MKAATCLQLALSVPAFGNGYLRKKCPVGATFEQLNRHFVSRMSEDWIPTPVEAGLFTPPILCKHAKGIPHSRNQIAMSFWVRQGAQRSVQAKYVHVLKCPNCQPVRWAGSDIWESVGGEASAGCPSAGRCRSHAWPVARATQTCPQRFGRPSCRCAS